MLHHSSGICLVREELIPLKNAAELFKIDVLPYGSIFLSGPCLPEGSRIVVLSEVYLSKFGLLLHPFQARSDCW